jgi:hypothetical protein
MTAYENTFALMVLPKLLGKKSSRQEDCELIKILCVSICTILLVLRLHFH